MKIVSETIALDGTKKFLIELDDGMKIESVLIFHKRTVCACLSVQVGCAMNCAFCATGKMGFSRNLTVEEIICQFELMNKVKPITNVVFMGMGEPLLNLLAVKEAIIYIHSLGISWRKLTLSTVGIPDKLRELKEVKCKLTLSLHAPNDEIRSRIMPVNLRFSISEVFSALKELPFHKKNPLVVAYNLIAGVNDSLDNAKDLARLLEQLPFVEVNIIPFNLIPGIDFQRPSEEIAKAFKQVLIDAGYKTIIRTTKGLDAGAACGMLALKRESI